MCCSALTHLSTAYISASAEFLIVIDCHFEIQCRGHPIQIRYPENERDLNSYFCSFSVGSGNDWS